MGLCLWVRWSDYKPSVIYVSVCVSVCVLILVRLEASNQTGHGVGRGERNEWKGRQTEGGTKCIKCTCWGGGRILQATCTVRVQAGLAASITAQADGARLRRR